MTRDDALIDAALTVQGWQRDTRRRHIARRFGEPNPYTERCRIHVASSLQCAASWSAIEAAIVALNQEQ